ncbi:SDR family oxidoreductase [Paenibacillus sp. P96]|uniref:dTDP-4-dehydrorhamnose reductase n=1 Tax=Paenibacillus zeirhizosphaerae TaxID=2987519 RepID=A0ABT9FUT0_9BACL|nr:SDR family oxidoreductase [Paenibacillus sp. P96]MDP4098492.1 SDR family oxidoreductase [Paenibacillus sp. P96]
MKILVLGGNGMAGHMLVQYFRQQGGHRVYYTTRDPSDTDGLLLDATDFGMAESLIQAVRPSILINAVGVLNQFAEEDKVKAYEINGILPHRLRKAADLINARLIHISTDCVFSGARGGYSEQDATDGTSAYALTKALGEVRATGHLTIRTSIIGPEIRKGGIGLFQWFMQQKGKVSGYRQVMWNGVTTLELAKAIDVLMKQELSGLVHLACPQSVSKHDLLQMMQQIWGKEDVSIIPVNMPVQDRTLQSTRPDMKYAVPDYRDMLEELHSWIRNH